MNSEQILQEILKKHLADDAWNTMNFQVTPRVQKLVKGVNYLMTQSKILYKLDKDEQEEHYNDMMESLIRILTKDD